MVKRVLPALTGDEARRRQRTIAVALSAPEARGATFVWVRNRYGVYQSCLWRTWTMPDDQWEQFVKWIAGFGGDGANR